MIPAACNAVMFESRVEELALWHTRGLHWSPRRRQVHYLDALRSYTRQSVAAHRCECGERDAFDHRWGCHAVALRPLDGAGFGVLSDPPETQRAPKRRRLGIF